MLITSCLISVGFFDPDGETMVSVKMVISFRIFTCSEYEGNVGVAVKQKDMLC